MSFKAKEINNDHPIPGFVHGSQDGINDRPVPDRDPFSADDGNARPSNTDKDAKRQALPPTLCNRFL